MTEVIEGDRVLEKLLALRALFNIKVSNPVYNAVPPSGFLLTDDIMTKLGGGDAQEIKEACPRIRKVVQQFKEKIQAGDLRSPVVTAATLLDKQKTIKLKAFEQSVAVKLQQFKVKYSEDHFPVETWQPNDAKAYPQFTNFVKTSLLSATRHNPKLKNAIMKIEAPDLEIYRLIMKRYAAKTDAARSSGVRSSKSIRQTHFSVEPRSQRQLSKQRELKMEVIPELVHFMPKLEHYAQTELAEQVHDVATDSDNDLASSSDEED